ncbi:hypothetical protein [Gordonia sp. (in: high G+C Gram-positive bacteria)]|uniref:hypothetical protein n=1 Tax=Gordonia sp. (in: high G+C Gram-positive bacteria) TaxID=84139 RepID=UPI003526EB2D
MRKPTPVPYLIVILLLLVVTPAGAAAAPGLGGTGYVAVSPTAGRLIARSDFDVKRDGFSFANWGGPTGKHTGSEVTADIVRQVVGDEACARIVAGRCHLSAAAEVMRDQFNSLIDGGHCMGMAAVSALARQNLIARTDGLTAGEPVFALPQSRALDRLISRYAAAQLVEPVNSAWSVAPVRDILHRLTAIWAAGGNYVLGVTGDIGGHAVVPIALRDLGGGYTGIVIYDNNFPGEEKMIVANAARNTWYYTTALNPAEKSYLFGASPKYSMDLMPLDVLTRPGECPICKGIGDDDVLVTLADASESTPRQSETPWDLAVTRPDGTPIPAAVEESAIANDPSQQIRLPGNVPFVLRMGGVRSGSAKVDIGAFGDGWVNQIKNVEIPAGATVTLSVNRTGSKIVLTSSAIGETAQINMGTDDPSGSTAVKVSGLPVRVGMPLIAERTASGLYRFTIEDLLPATGVRVQVQTSDAATDRFAQTPAPVDVPGRSVISVPTGRWSGSSLKAGVSGPLSTGEIVLK